MDNLHPMFKDIFSTHLGIVCPKLDNVRPLNDNEKQDVLAIMLRAIKALEQRSVNEGIRRSGYARREE